MGWFSDKKETAIGTPAARQNLKDKRANLAKVTDREVAKNGGKPIGETKAFRKANRKVIAAEQKVPFWGRW